MKTYKVPSSSGSGHYLVRKMGSGKYACTCTGFKFRQYCKHIKQVSSGQVEKLDEVPSFDLGFIKPMLAKPLPEPFTVITGRHFAERKFDGHRMIVRVKQGQVTAWSRLGNARALGEHLTKVLEQFPNGTYDGELIMGTGRSYDVVRKEKQHQTSLVLFDVLRLLNVDTTKLKWRERRDLLMEIFGRTFMMKQRAVKLATATMLKDEEHIQILLNQVWDEDGEGLIIKDAKATYVPGKRTHAFYKIKALRSAALTVTGFRPSKGTKVNRGPYAITLLVDSKGNETKVKTKDDATCRLLERKGKSFIGRKLRIEYQERTPDGGYRHPRWDRWEDE